MCNHCSQVLQCSSEYLLLHSRSCPSVRRLDRNHTFVCSICDYNTYHCTRMKIHLRQHTGEKPYTCSKCSYSVSHLSNLRRHNFIKHSEINKWNLNNVLFIIWISQFLHGKTIHCISDVICHHCSQVLQCSSEYLLLHSRSCPSVRRYDRNNNNETETIIMGRWPRIWS
jgi:hypothetical protein